MKRIGVFSGAFDPIHRGHLRVIQELFAQKALDEILLLPNEHAPYRKPHADRQHLRAMVQEAIREMPDVRLCESEWLEGCTDSVEVMQCIALHNPQAQLTYIIGADKLAGLLHWRKAGQLFEQCDLVVFPREGFQGREMTRFAGSKGIRARLLQVPHLSISSSGVRGEIAAFSDALHMILPQTARYIARNGLYQKDYLQMVKGQLKDKRLAHTLGVRDLAVDLAHHYGLSMQRAAVAALLHDSAKCMKLGQLQAIAKKYKLRAPGIDYNSHALLHSQVGALLARLRFGVEDAEILDAIRWHTTGRSHMTGMDLCIFVADAAEPTRSQYPGLEDIRREMWVDLRGAALIAMQGTKKFVVSRGLPFDEAGDEAILDLQAALK